MLERLLRVRAVEEPEQVVRIDALSKGSVIHRIFERFYDEWRGTGPAPLAPDAERRMRRIAGEECDAARDRGETGYPAMWEADRVELIEDCVRWLERERDDELTRLLPQVAVEARFGQRMDRGEAGVPVADRADRDRAALRRAAPARPDRPGQLGRAALPASAWSTTRAAASTPSKSGELQGGRMLQLPLYVLAASKLLGIDPAGGAAAYVYPTRKGGFEIVDWTPEDIAARHADVIALLDAIVSAARRGDFIIAPSRGRVQMVPVQHDVPRRQRRLRGAQGGRRRGSPDSRPRSGASHERRAARPGGPPADRRATSTRTSASRPAPGTGKTTVLVERVTNVLATGAATVDQLVVITFTEKAAAELSTRVRDALERRLARAEGRGARAD